MEFTPEIEDLILELEDKDEELTEREQHIVNIVETAKLLNEEGLYAFWMSPMSHEQILSSFDTIGAYEIHDLFQSSQWLEDKNEDQELTEIEYSHLEEIESDLPTQLELLPDILVEYLELEG